MFHSPVAYFFRIIVYPMMNLLSYPFLWYVKKIFQRSPSATAMGAYKRYSKERTKGFLYYKHSGAWKSFERLRKNIPVQSAIVLQFLAYYYPFETGELAKKFVSENLSGRRIAKRIVEDHLRQFYKELLKIEELSTHERNVITKYLKNLDD